MGFNSSAATHHALSFPNELTGIPALYRYVRFVRKPIPVMRALYRECGPITAFRFRSPLSQKEALLVTAFAPEYNERVLTNPDLFLATGMMRRGKRHSAHWRLRFGLISMNGEQHRSHRRLVQPPFRKKEMGNYRDVITDLTVKMLDGWEPGEQRDIARDMQELALRVSSTLLFGGSDPEHAYKVGSMIDKWLTMCFYPSAYFFPLNIPCTPFRRLMSHARSLEAEIRTMVESRRREGAGGSDILSILVRAREEGGVVRSDEELMGQANILFAAAHETTMNALTWTLFLLAQHPEVAADLLDELRSELGGDPPRLDQFPRLGLLEGVIKESLRLLPPVIYKTRRVAQATHLGPYHLPKGSRVLYSHYMTHRLPELFADPDRFKPRRWETLKPSPFAYLPFGAGPRLCIGYEFSMTMLRITLAMIVQRYRLSLRPGAKIDCKFAVTLAPRDGMPMVVHNQDGAFTRESVRGDICDIVDLRAR